MPSSVGAVALDQVHDVVRDHRREPAHLLASVGEVVGDVAGAPTMHFNSDGSRPASSADSRAVAMIQLMISGSASWMITPSPTRPATPSAFGP